MLSQQMQALEVANDQRFGVAEFRRRMKLGSHPGFPGSRPAIANVAVRIREAADLLRSGSSMVGRMRVHAFLDAIPTFGDDRVRRLLQANQIWPLRRVDSLTLRQREVLASELDRVASGGVL